MNHIERISDRANIPLVAYWQNLMGNSLFVTISPNPKTLHTCVKQIKGKSVDVKIRYNLLPHKQQYEYCMRIVERCYNYSNDTQIYGSWEFNKEGNVHFHFLMHDPNIQTNTDLIILRRDVLNHPSVMLNLIKGRKGDIHDWMNNIVYVNDSIPIRFEYIQKDIDETLKHFPYYKLIKEEVIKSD